MFNIKSASENSIIIYFGDQMSPDLIEKISFYCQLLTDKLADIIIDVVPSYTSLLISYRLNLINQQDMCDRVEKYLLSHNIDTVESSSKLIEIPVYYDFEVGLDLEELLSEKQLSLEEFIAIHSSKEYLVYAIGFSPAFAFLGEVDQRIIKNRLPSPRIQIPAGSVGIADNQTAVYPINSSGGWNIIGRSPLDFSLDNPDNLKRFAVGGSIRFVPIDKDKYLALGGIL